MRPIAYGNTDVRFVACMPFVLEQEGVPGNDYDPHDPGGRTHEGIIQSEYNGFRALKKRPMQSVWKATDLEVDEIYHEQYWVPWCPKLWPGLDLCYFDQKVNEGPHQAALDLQRALIDGGAKLALDGWLGLATLAACHAVHDRKALLQRYCDRRLGFYRHLKNFSYFGKGWTRREVACLDASVAMLA